MPRRMAAFEPLVALRMCVAASQAAALIHPVETPWCAPYEAHREPSF